MDGPALSFTAAENHLVNHWKIDEAVRNGADVFSEYDEETYKFEANGDLERLESSLIVDILVGTSSEIELGKGSWFFRKQVTDRGYIYLYV